MHNKYWKSAKTSKNIEYIEYIEYITCLLNILTCMPSFNFYKCNYCYKYVVNLAMHILVDCKDNLLKRSIFWDCVAIYFPTDILQDLQSQSSEELYESILGKCFSPLLDRDIELHQNFILLTAVYSYISLKQA